MTDAESPVAIVTGATGLIGTEICAALTTAGSRVVALDARDAQVQAELMLCVDLTDADAVAAAAERVRIDYGRVDQLVHAAALTARTPGPGVHGELMSLDSTMWRRLIDVNLSSALICVQRFAELLRRSSSPAVVIIGSIQGLVPTLGTGAYAVTKAALVGLTRQLAAELAPEAITVNMLAPGPIADADQRVASTHPAPTPMRRWGTPDEVAGAVSRLLEPSFRYLTGAVIPLDGGEHLRPRPGQRSSSAAGAQEER